MRNSPQVSQQPSSSSPQQPRKRKRAKVAKYLTGVRSFLAAIAAIVAILQFTLGIQNVPNLITRPPSPVPTLQPTSLSQNPTALNSTPTPISIHLITCYAASTENGILKVFTQGGTVVCFSGTGTMDYIIQPVVRVETGTIFATWQYVTLSTGASHHSPANSPYNCPGKVAHYDGGYMMRVTQITIVSHSPSCS
jgi:hypothetical protein